MKPVSGTAALLVIFASAGLAFAPPAAIGVARSKAAFMMENASVTGNGQVTDGAAVRTFAAAAEVTLNDGERINLGPASQAKVYGKRVALEMGRVDVERVSGYRVEAKGLKIRGDADTRLRVAADGAVRVSAMEGAAEVRNSAGGLIARIPPGATLQFQPAPPEAVRVSGALETRGGRLFLTDDCLKVTLELRGGGVLARLVGQRTSVSGTVIPGEAASMSAAHVIAVSQATPGAAGGGPAVLGGFSVSAGAPALAALAGGEQTAAVH